MSEDANRTAGIKAVGKMIDEGKIAGSGRDEAMDQLHRQAEEDRAREQRGS